MQRLPSPDRSLRKPGLFVIGAMKSGTSYLSRLLGLHPSIFIPDLEEPSYFVPPGQLRDIWPYMWDQGIWRSEEAYLRLFQPGGDATILGEASTNYSKVPLVSGVPERIARFNDEARFIYIMRDPVERSISHYWHMVRFNAEYRPMLSAILQDPRYMAVSHYARQLAPYFSLFGRERVFTLTFEELVPRYRKRDATHLRLARPRSFRCRAHGIRLRGKCHARRRGAAVLFRIGASPAYFHTSADHHAISAYSHSRSSQTTDIRPRGAPNN